MPGVAITSNRRIRPTNSVSVDPDIDPRANAYRLPRFHKYSMKRCTKEKAENYREDDLDQQDGEQDASGYLSDYLPPLHVNQY